jgi:hypothetical protein
VIKVGTPTTEVLTTKEEVVEAFKGVSKGIILMMNDLQHRALIDEDNNKRYKISLDDLYDMITQ